MNSSGIKRGLAASAVAALAVAGIPALATSAQAVAGDDLKVAFTGPALDGGTTGAEIVLETKGVVDAADATARLKVFKSDLSGTGGAGSADNANQTIGAITVVGYKADSDTTQEFGVGDGFGELTVRIPVDTAPTGGTANFALVLDDAATPGVQANEARAQVAVTTGGAVANLEISPSSQTAPQNTDSGNYTLTLRDSAGRATQLGAAEAVALTAPGATVSDGSIDAVEAVRGADTFTAKAASVGAYIITADGPNSSQATATLQVVKAAGNFTKDDIDIVTQADGWDGFGDGTYDVTSTDIPVRVDQTSVKIDIQSHAAGNADANGVVALKVTGGNMTFGGKSETIVTTTLNANGAGSVTITPDAGTIQDGDTINIDGHGLAMQLDFTRGQLTAVNAEAETYISKLDGTVDITVVATDSFGLPVAGAYVDAQRAGVNADATPSAKKVTDANGKATFTFTDVNATNNSTDTVTFRVFQDQFAADPIDPDGDSDFAEHYDTATIRYTTEGTGSDYVLNLDNLNASGAAYDPASVSVVPLTDTNANVTGLATGDEEVVLDIVGGDTGAPATVSVDNGALLLRSGETRLAQGSASEDIVLPDAGAQQLRIIGTKSGLVTVTVASGGRTHTAQFTVEAQSDATTARNLTLSGPAEADAGTLATFTAVVTDAFGNPIKNVGVNDLNVQVSGPGALQDTGAVTDENGAIALNVRLQDDASGPVEVKVTGIPDGANNQFGAAENQLDTASGANSAPGLSASSNVASATVLAVAPVEKVDAGLVVRGRGGKIDRVKGNAISDAAGAKAILLRNGKKVKSGVLNDNGNVTFRIKDRNGNKKTKYTVKVRATELTLKDSASKRIR